MELVNGFYPVFIQTSGTGLYVFSISWSAVLGWLCFELLTLLICFMIYINSLYLRGHVS